MAEVTLSPIPVDGGYIRDLRGGDVCMMSSGVYFTVHSQYSPGYTFGTLVSISGEDTETPVSTVIRSEILVGLECSSGHASFDCAKMDDDHVVITRLYSNTAYAFLIHIDPVTKAMSQAAPAIQLNSAMTGEILVNSQLGLSYIQDGLVGLSYVGSDRYGYIEQLLWDGTTFSKENIYTSSVQLDNEARYGYNFSFTQSKVGGWFATWSYRTENYGTERVNWRPIREVFKIVFGANPSATTISHHQSMSTPPGMAPDNDTMYLMSSADEYTLAGSSPAVYGTWIQSLGQNDGMLGYYANWHQTGNDDPSTFIYIAGYPDSWTSNYDVTSDNHDYYMYVGKIVDQRPVVSPASSSGIQFSLTDNGKDVKPMSHFPFEKVSETTIVHYGCADETNSSTHRFVFSYINF